MSFLLDEDFSSYSVGANPPFANLANVGAGACTIVNSPAGPYTDVKCLNVPANSGVEWPILPTITLPQALAGVTYTSLGVPSYAQATVCLALYIDYYPTMAGELLKFWSSANPFSGLDIATVRLLTDGTVAITSPGTSVFSPNQAISTFSLTPGKWYFFQVNISLSTNAGFVQADITVAVNGVPTVTSNWVTTQAIGGVPALYFNNIDFYGVGNGCEIGRLTINDVVQTMPSFPHAGSPVARITQGVIELAKSVDAADTISIACPIGGGAASVGTMYSKFPVVTGGVAPFTYAITAGSLPPGLSLNASTGEISGIPITGGVYTYTITVTDFETLTASSPSCSITVAVPGLCQERIGPKIYFWEPSFLDRPEDTAERATDYEDSGLVGAKFFQGFTLQCDTQGVDKQIQIQGDSGTILQTFTINHNGETIKPYVFNPAKVASLVRVIGLDDVAWRFFGIRYIWEPLPELVTYYETQGTAHDLPGYQFLKDGYISLISSADVTLTVNVDGVDYVYTIPSTSGQHRKVYLIFGINQSTGRTLKGKQYRYILSSSAGFRLYQKDCEVRIHDWSGGDYVVKQPFGDSSRVYGARI